MHTIQGSTVPCQPRWLAGELDPRSDGPTKIRLPCQFGIFRQRELSRLVTIPITEVSGELHFDFQQLLNKASGALVEII